jgi:uncharacterized protein
MAHDPSKDEPTLAAGDFSPWMGEMDRALRGDGGSDVPCDGCTACCRSSQFVHIGPDEADTLAHIPADLLFPAPRLPVGHVLLGYADRGHCPMLIDNRCSIYEHRPRTCRTYDCRVLPAAGLEGDDDKVSIARQARRWRFTFPTRGDRVEYDAVGAAVTFLDQHQHVVSAASVPMSPTQIAVLAIQVHRVFLRHDEATGEPSVVDPDPEVVRTEVLRVIGATDAT